jgi:hypothetical protein
MTYSSPFNSGGDAPQGGEQLGVRPLCALWRLRGGFGGLWGRPHRQVSWDFLSVLWIRIRRKSFRRSGQLRILS